MPRAALIAEPPAPVRVPRSRAWIVTVLATALSTYALDAFAIAAGTALAASGMLGGLAYGPLVAVLAVTYVAWGAGLRSNLASNWSLLMRTGASTNAFSKAAYDVARGRGADLRGRRRAASAGYVLTELAKELPYYAGAGGAALVSGSVSAEDALVFLAGTNIGAALYEYGVAHATRAFLRFQSRGGTAAAHRASVTGY